jgi:hypothetical protein
LKVMFNGNCMITFPSRLAASVKLNEYPKQREFPISYFRSWHIRTR